MKSTTSEPCLTVRWVHLAGSVVHRSINKRMLTLEKQFHVRKQDWLHCSPKVRAAATSKTSRDSYRACFGSPIEKTKGGSASAGWTFTTTRTRTHLISLPYSRLLATTNGRSYLVRPVSLSSWLINVVAGPPLENLSFLVAQEVVERKQFHSCFSNRGH